ncbi:hypothetical protein [Scytonema sp. PCC 10023]|uniref:hypothetical protein n=1 Tax=Scytonema sp. PCC 10023 TaxID=1680591 RepID=UPI0039C7154F
MAIAIEVRYFAVATFKDFEKILELLELLAVGADCAQLALLHRCSPETRKGLYTHRIG